MSESVEIVTKDDIQRIRDAIDDIGLEFANSRHVWTAGQRRAWEKADKEVSRVEKIINA